MTNRYRAARVWAPAALAGLIVMAAWVFADRVAGRMPDLDVYLRAGSRAAAAEPLYRAEDGHYQFKYLPAFAIALIPAAALDMAVARATWFSASLLFLAALLYASVALVGAMRAERHGPARKPPWLLVAVAVIVLGKFYAHELVLGQVNLPFAFVVVSAALAMHRRREALAGGLVALAVVLKPYGVLLVPWLVARRSRRSIAAATLGLAVVLLAPSAIYGLAGNIALHRAWWETVTATTAPNLLNPDNVSWLAMYARWFGPEGPHGPTSFVLTASCAVGLAAWMWGGREELRFPEGIEVALLLVAIPFLSPQGWDYVLLVATPAVMIVVAFEHRLPPALRWGTFAALATVGLTIYDVMGRTAYHAFMNASGITLCFFVVIAALAMLRLRGAA